MSIFFFKILTVYFFQDTVLGIQALAELACSRKASEDQNVNVTVISNQTTYSFEPITNGNNMLLQRAEVSHKRQSFTNE